MPPLKQFTLASIALLTLSLGLTACGSKNQSSQEYHLWVIRRFTSNATTQNLVQYGCNQKPFA